jgi:hypothetical protein
MRLFGDRCEKSAESSELLRCSFCRKTEGEVGKLVSNPGEPRVYICSECIAVCNAILPEDKAWPIPKRAPNIEAPDASEYAPYYGWYISLVKAGDILAALAEQAEETWALFAGLSDVQGHYRYAPEKWSVKEVLGHVIDVERVFAYRALRIARNDRTPLPGFEQDDYVRYGGFASQRLADLIEEFVCVRRANLMLFQQFSPEAWMRLGTADEKAISVRAIAYIMAGHELHHRQVLKEKYGIASCPLLDTSSHVRSVPAP